MVVLGRLASLDFNARVDLQWSPRFSRNRSVRVYLELWLVT